ncbi:MAG TPA: extracellular solute-binding protein [Candidatus Binatia bacterium]
MMWYTSLTGGPNQEVPKAFEAKYPGIKVDVYRGDSDAIIQRVLQEAQAKRNLVDTIETTFPILKVMQEYKLLTPYFSPHLASYPDEVKEKAEKGLVYWATDRESYIGLAYNTNVVPEKGALKNFDDLLQPELRGKIGFATSDTGNRVLGAMLATKGPEFIPKLKAQILFFTESPAGRLLIWLSPASSDYLPPYFSAIRALRFQRARRSSGWRWISCRPMPAEWRTCQRAAPP